MPDIWPTFDIRQITGYPALEISRLSGIRKFLLFSIGYWKARISIPTLIPGDINVTCATNRSPKARTWSRTCEPIQEKSHSHVIYATNLTEILTRWKITGKWNTAAGRNYLSVTCARNLSTVVMPGWNTSDNTQVNNEDPILLYTRVQHLWSKTI